MSGLYYKNAFLLTDDPAVLLRGQNSGVKKTTVATMHPKRFDGLMGVEVLRIVESIEDASGFDALYLPSLETDHDIIDACVRAAVKDNARLYIGAFSDLHETGRIEAKYKLSPAMLLYKLGVLDRTTIVGGVHLDRDDIALMGECGAKLIVLPIFDLMSGHGAAPIMSLLKHEVDIKIGTGSPRFNFSCDIRLEAFMLQAALSGIMERARLIPESALYKMCADGNESAFINELYTR